MSAHSSQTRRWKHGAACGTGSEESGAWAEGRGEGQSEPHLRCEESVE